jgi:NAD(P)-dependent dehydrogenase (short-subunit alcohol dehydrogenase family)
MSGEAGVVVTGASSGIGEACALHLQAAGFRVFAGVRKAEDANRLSRVASARLTPVYLDIVEEGSIRSAVETVKSELGGLPLKGLVNNAGVALGGPLEFVPIDSLRRQLEVNVVGQIAVTQAFLPMLRESSGRIVNIGSVSGRLGLPLLGPYSASKFALRALTDSLRMELRPWKISVSLVEAGVITTPIWQKAIEAGEEMLAQTGDEVLELYAPAIAATRKAIETTPGIPAERVAEVVTRALTARTAGARYLVGTDARIRIPLSFLPPRLLDWLVTRRLAALQKSRD